MAEFRCIWCLRSGARLAFDVSHVLPEALGNAGQQTLPKGLVCKDCNQYFGSKIEPVLLDHPPIHLMAVQLRIVDPGDGLAFRDQLFDAAHSSIDPVQRHASVHTDINLKEGRVDYVVGFDVHGRMRRPIDPRTMAKVSRGVHKIAFENLAWSVINHRIEVPIDLLSSTFEPVRRWARYGGGPGEVRPFVWATTQTISTDFGSLIRIEGDRIGVDLDIFDQRYAVSLTSTTADVRRDLTDWCAVGDGMLALMCSETFEILGQGPGQPAS
jgi:hypothetical protein